MLNYSKGANVGVHIPAPWILWDLSPGKLYSGLGRWAKLRGCSEVLNFFNRSLSIAVSLLFPALIPILFRLHFLLGGSPRLFLRPPTCSLITVFPDDSPSLLVEWRNPNAYSITSQFWLVFCPFPLWPPKLHGRMIISQLKLPGGVNTPFSGYSHSSHNIAITYTSSFLLVNWVHIIPHDQWPFQDPRLEEPKAYCSGLNFREYPHKIWPYMVLTYLHFRILEFPLTW